MSDSEEEGLKKEMEKSMARRAELFAQLRESQDKQWKYFLIQIICLIGSLICTMVVIAYQIVCQYSV